MAKVKEDVSRVRLEVDGKQGINELGKLEMQAKELRIDIKQAKKGTDEYVAANKKLKQVNKDIAAMRKELGLSGMTMTQLSRYQRDLRKEIQNTTTKGTADYKRLNAELQKVNRALVQQRKELNGTKGFFGDIKKEMKAFAVASVGFLGVTELFSGLQNLVSGSAGLSDLLADVQKTTELTDEELKDLMKTMKGFNTRTPRSELLALAAEAGKMGIRGVDSISQYVQQTNELTTALGDLGDDAGLKVAKMADRFNVSMRQIGSGINAVADNTKATAPFITEFLSRLGGIANEVDIQAGDILGYGAAIDEMGLNVEMSSTALNKFFIDFTKNTEKFGRAAGFAEGELSKLIGEQGTNEGFLLFLERLKETNPEADQFLQKLEEIGIDGSRGSQVFLALSQNVDQLRDRQALANTEIAKGTSLTEEYNRKNENFAGNLQKIQKWFASFFINGGVLDGMAKFVGYWAKWIEIPVSKKMEDERIAMQTMLIRIKDVNIESGERVKLIQELQKMYPDYLGNIDAEFINNENLTKAIRRVNDELINKIVLQRQDEKIQEQQEYLGERRIKQFELEDKILQQMVKVQEKYNLEIDHSLPLAEQAIKLAEDASDKGGLLDNLFGSNVSELMTNGQLLQDFLKDTTDQEEYSNSLLSERAELVERLGIKSKQAIEPVKGLSRAAWLGGGTEPTVTDGQVNDFANSTIAAFERYQATAIESTDAVREATEVLYEDLIALGKKHNLDMAKVEEQRALQRKQGAIWALEEEIKIAEAKQQIAQGLSVSLGATIDFIGNRQGELTGFQKILAIAQIAIDSAAALGKVVPLAVEAASGTGPAAPFVLAGYIATMSGTVLTAIARAKQALTDANVPDWNPVDGEREPRRGRGTPAVKKSFYHGGFTGSASMGLGDQYGAFAGAVHQREYVIPEVTLSDPIVANLMPAIEQIRQETVAGRSGSAVGFDTAKLEAKLDQLIAINSRFPKEIKGKWVYSDLEEIQEEEVLLRNRYFA